VVPTGSNCVNTGGFAGSTTAPGTWYTHSNFEGVHCMATVDKLRL
jgi:hypothetical protein